MLRILKKPISVLILVGLISFLILFLHAIFTNKPFTTIQKVYPQSIFLQRKEGELFKGDKITGEFRAISDNLGIVSIRFQTFNRVNYGMFVFRIKERGKNKLNYENKYMAEKFGGYTFFPFGFPVIEDSDGKYFYFELESLDSLIGNSVALSNDEPAIIATYKFTISQLLSDKKILLSFIFHKSKNILEYTQVLRMFILFYSTLIFLFVIYYSRKKLYSLFLFLPAFFSVVFPFLKIFFSFHKKFSIEFNIKFWLKKKVLILKKWILRGGLVVWFVVRILIFIFKFILKMIEFFYKWIRIE